MRPTATFLPTVSGDAVDTGPKLSNADIEAIAHRVVALMNNQPAGSGRYVDAAKLAIELDVDRDWVYAHREELGGFRLGGPRGRLRFDLVKVRQTFGLEEQVSSAPRLPYRGKKNEPSRSGPSSRLGSTQKQRRASVGAPARSPKRHQPGGSPMMKPERHDSPSSRGAS